MSPDKLIKYFAPLFVIAIISRSIEAISFVYYLVPVLCLVFIALGIGLVKGKKLEARSESPDDKGKRFNDQILHPSSIIHHPSSILNQPYSLIILPAAWFLITSLWSSYPEVSAMRALYFLLISSGSIAAGVLWVKYSGKSFSDLILPSNIIIILLCFFSLLTGIPSDSWTGGHGKGFMGFFDHQNILASVILFTLPSVIPKFLRLRRLKADHTTELKNYYLQLIAYSLLLTANLLFLVLTYSRTSIVALLAGIIILLLLSERWRALFYGFSIAAILFVIVFLNPTIKNFSSNIIKKDFPEFYSSRLWMWEPSYRAALEGGISGLGYGVSHPDIRPGNTGDHYEGERFVREKGNSVLALIEESGVAGLLLFLFPVAYWLFAGMRPIYPEEDENDPSLLLQPDYGIRYQMRHIIIAFILAFIIHAQFEAWWVGVGSVQLPLFYIYLGLLVQRSKVAG